MKVGSNFKCRSHCLGYVQQSFDHASVHCLPGSAPPPGHAAQVLNYKQIHVVTKNFCKGRYIDIMYMFMTFVNFLAVVLVTFTVLYELPCIKSNNVVSEQA